MARGQEQEPETKPVDPTIADILAKLAGIAERNNEVQREQLKQTAPKSLSAGPRISHFNPQGEHTYPMPALKCEIIAPYSQKPEWHAFDWEEVELLNLLEPMDGSIELNDGSTLPVCVVGRRNHVSGNLETLGLYGAYDPDEKQHTALFKDQNKQQFPPLKTILRQLIAQTPGGEEKIAQVMTMKERYAKVKSGELPVSKGS